MSFSDFSKVETLKELNSFLADKSYIQGYVLIVHKWFYMFPQTIRVRK